MNPLGPRVTKCVFRGEGQDGERHNQGHPVRAGAEGIGFAVFDRGSSGTFDDLTQQLLVPLCGAPELHLYPSEQLQRLREATLDILDLLSR